MKVIDVDRDESQNSYTGTGYPMVYNSLCVIQHGIQDSWDFIRYVKKRGLHSASPITFFNEIFPLDHTYN